MTKPLPLRIAEELERILPHEAAATLRAQHKLIGELVEAAQAVAEHIEGELPTRGWLRDNDASRAALGRMCAVLLSAKEQQP